jgi:hypothetical protein
VKPETETGLGMLQLPQMLESKLFWLKVKFTVTSTPEYQVVSVTSL